MARSLAKIVIAARPKREEGNCQDRAAASAISAAKNPEDHSIGARPERSFRGKEVLAGVRVRRPVRHLGREVEEEVLFLVRGAIVPLRRVATRTRSISISISTCRSFLGLSSIRTYTSFPSRRKASAPTGEKDLLQELV